jgi:tetratricopeptide (TPR) repeat protein
LQSQSDERFTDRANAIAAFQQFAMSPSGGALSFWGMAGQGKSSLLVQLMTLVPNPAATILVDLNHYFGPNFTEPTAETASQIVHRVGNFIIENSHGRFRSRYLRARFETHLRRIDQRAKNMRADVRLSAESGGSIANSNVHVHMQPGLAATYQETYAGLLMTLRRYVPPSRRTMYIFFDSSERMQVFDSSVEPGATPENWFFREFLPTLIALVPEARVVISGRDRIARTSLVLQEYEISSWTEEDTGTFLAASGISDKETVQAIHQLCRGVPIWTSMAVDVLLTGSPAPPELQFRILDEARGRPASEWLPQAFLRRLAPQQREVVIAACVLRRITKEAIEHVCESKPWPDDWYEQLCALSFVKTSRTSTSRNRAIHELIRESVLLHLNWEEPLRLGRLHNRAADYWSLHYDFTEEAYHRLATGDVGPMTKWREEYLVASTLFDVAQCDKLTSVIVNPEVERVLINDAPEIVAEGRLRQAQIRHQQGQYDRARTIAQKSLQLLPEGSGGIVCEGHELLGDLELLRGEVASAEGHYEEERRLAEALNALTPLAASYSSLGDIARRRGQLSTAESYYRESLITAQSAKDASREAKALRAMGKLAAQQGRYEEATEFLRHALGIQDRRTDTLERARTGNALGACLAQLGQPREAIEHHQLALNLARSCSSTLHEANSLLHLGDAYLAAGETSQASSAFDSAGLLFQDLKAALGQARATRGAGDAAIATGDPIGAVVRYRTAADMFAAAGASRGLARALLSLAFAHAKSVPLPTAQESPRDDGGSEALERARALYESMGIANTEAVDWKRLQLLWSSSKKGVGPNVD